MMPNGLPARSYAEAAPSVRQADRGDPCGIAFALADTRELRGSIAIRWCCGCRLHRDGQRIDQLLEAPLRGDSPTAPASTRERRGRSRASGPTSSPPTEGPGRHLRPAQPCLPRCRQPGPPRCSSPACRVDTVPLRP